MCRAPGPCLRRRRPRLPPLAHPARPAPLKKKKKKRDGWSETEVAAVWSSLALAHPNLRASKSKQFFQCFWKKKHSVSSAFYFFGRPILSVLNAFTYVNIIHPSRSEWNPRSPVKHSLTSPTHGDFFSNIIEWLSLSISIILTLRK